MLLPTNPKSERNTKKKKEKIQKKIEKETEARKTRKDNEKKGRREKQRGKIVCQKWVEFRAIDVTRLFVDFSPPSRRFAWFFFKPERFSLFLSTWYTAILFCRGSRARVSKRILRSVTAFERDPSNLSLRRIHRCESNRLTAEPAVVVFGGRPSTYQTVSALTVYSLAFSLFQLFRVHSETFSDKFRWRNSGTKGQRWKLRINYLHFIGLDP